MISDPIALVTVGVLALTVLAILSCVMLVLHHAVSELRQRRRERRTQDAMLLLAPAIVMATELPEAAGSAVRRFGRDAVGYASVVLSDRRSVPDAFRELAEHE